jgi:nucleoside-diphosphate-sugar epimerase
MEFNLDGRRVLVVGGAGYVGAVLVPMLSSCGAKVRILDQLIYDNGFAIQHLLDQGDIGFTRGDLRDEETFLRGAEGATDVVLLAALVGDPICKKYPDLAVGVNLEGSSRIIDNLQRTGAGRFVFTSTCSNYGIQDPNHLADEDAELNPQSLYARTKVDLENYLLNKAGSARWTGTVLRLSTAYGFSPRMRFDLTVSQFAWELAAGKPLLVYDPDTWRPYCHVADISRAILCVLTRPSEAVRARVFNVGSDTQQFTKRMIVELVRKHVPGSQVEYRSGDTDPRNYRVSFARLAGQLGFQCRHTVEDYIPVVAEATINGVFARAGEDHRNGNYEVRHLAPPHREAA